MRNKTVKITLINDSVWYVPKEEFNTFNVPESPESVIGGYIRGSKGPLIRVNKSEDMSGEYTYINANFILTMDVTYTN